MISLRSDNALSQTSHSLVSLPSPEIGAILLLVRQTQSKRKRVCKPCLCTLYTVVPREKYMSIPAAYAMSEDFVCSY